MVDFLDLHARRNPGLIRVAVELHQSGQIPPNVVVMDLDAIKQNAIVERKEADRFGVSNYFMTKEFGRNPLVSKTISDNGIEKAVAIDIEEVKCLHRYGIPVGHVGHLSQVPTGDIEYVVGEVSPEVITVFSVEKAKQISDVAAKLGKSQDLLIRVVGKGDFFYPYQHGGIPAERVVELAHKIGEFRNIRIVGVTSFPCTRYNILRQRVEPVSNLSTILKAAAKLQEENKMEIKQVNAPGDTSAPVMEILADAVKSYGYPAYGEPGNGLTGTTPWHYFADLPELPAWVYVSEVSHLYGNNAYAYGGGLSGANLMLGFWTDIFHQFYMYAFVGRDPDTIVQRKVLAEPAGYIDYYGTLVPGQFGDVEMAVGDTVVYGFRIQVFASRAKVAVVKGIQKGKPELLGIFDRCGNMLDKKTETPLNVEHVRETMSKI